MDFTQADKATTSHTTNRKVGVPVRAFFARLLATRSLVCFVILLQILTISLVLKPTWISDLFNGTENYQVLSEVKAKVSITSTDTPVVAKVQDAEALRNENAIQEEIYKDAMNGDYVIGYSDRLIIYRRSEGKIIYDGDTPSSRLSKNNELIAEKIASKLVSAGVFTGDNTEVPQMTLVSDPSKFVAQDPTFYAQLKANDIIAVYNDSKLIVIYRFDEDRVLNLGSFETQINQSQVAGLGTSK